MSNYWNKMSPMNSLLSERVGKAKGGKIDKKKKKHKFGPHIDTGTGPTFPRPPQEIKKILKKQEGGRIGLRDRVFAKGGKVNTSKENRLEELGRVDSEKAFSKKGKRNLRGEKRRIVRELKK